MSAPFVLESRHEKCARKLSDCRDVPDILSIEIAMPLRIVIPHRVWPAGDDVMNSLGIERETLGQKNEIRREPLCLPLCPQLREPPSHEPLHAAVVDQKRRMTGALHCALHCRFHAPGIVASDQENPHVSLYRLSTPSPRGARTSPLRSSPPCSRASLRALHPSIRS